MTRTPNYDMVMEGRERFPFERVASPDFRLTLFRFLRIHSGLLGFVLVLVLVLESPTCQARFDQGQIEDEDEDEDEKEWRIFLASVSHPL